MSEGFYKIGLQTEKGYELVQEMWASSIISAYKEWARLNGIEKHQELDLKKYTYNGYKIVRIKGD